MVGRRSAAAVLAAEVTQYRRAQPLRRVQVKLANLGRSDVVQSTLRPGSRVDRPVPYGDAQCGAGLSASPGPGGGSVLVAARDGAGRSEVRVPLPDEHDRGARPKPGPSACCAVVRVR